MEKLDPLTPEGRRVLNEIKAREGEPGWVAPGGKSRLKDPVEHGWEEVERPAVDFNHLRSLGHIAGNPFYEHEGGDVA